MFRLLSTIQILVLILLPFAVPTEVEAAFPGDYSLYQVVTIDSTKVTASLTDYPIYIDLADLDVTGDDFWDTTTASCGDIRVTKDDGTTELPREVVDCDTSAKTGELHVKYSGTLSSSADTDIWIWYNGTDSDYSTSATYGAENVWSNYGAVYHMNESSGSIIDASTNANNGSVSGTLPNQTTGKLGSGQNFNGTSDEISVTDDASIKISTGAYTVQYWMKTTDTSTMYPFHYAAGDAISDDGLIIYKPSGASGKFRTLLRKSSSQDLTTGSVQINDGSWHYLVSRRNGSSVEQFVDATSDGTVTSAKDVSGSFPLYIGSGNGEDYMSGDLDELRIINDEYLTDAWIATEYNNQSSPSTFYSVGTEQGGGGGGPAPSRRIIRVVFDYSILVRGSKFDIV